MGRMRGGGNFNFQNITRFTSVSQIPESQKTLFNP